MELTTLRRLTKEELQFVKKEVDSRAKSPVVAYCLWLFFGLLGGHRYYLNKSRSAVVMTALLFIFGGFTVGLIISGLWALIDVFLIYRWLAHDKRNVEDATVQNVLLRRSWR
ncbi:TM2 domain-containing protein [Lactiplantibacillus garii]|uniref:TM2 domain-containing protein n=1 Tax=Lactiplantibacillus garii TaxID=2306423 RepID=A0A3R8J5Y7_9LACO|nr:TM2 domain-containing protein [Lactiplantibacillus garii]RRK09877.1 TM2 domain-containing protein [Lactiplantibacillus garii]